MSENIAPILQAGAQGAEEEARSFMGTLVAQILTIVRTIIAYLMDAMNRVIRWTGEHPLATLLTITNICIWVS